MFLNAGAKHWVDQKLLAVFTDRGAQHFVALNEIANGESQGFSVEFAIEFEGQRHVICQA